MYPVIVKELTNMKKFLFGLALVLFTSISAWSQESKLANQYYANGEYEKAAVLYERLYETTNQNYYYFKRYIDCLTALENYSDAEGFIKKALRSTPNEVQHYVTLGNLYELQFKDEEAKEQYDKAIKKLPADRLVVIKLAQAFAALTKYDEAIATYEKGSKLLKDDKVFAYNLGDLYRRKDDLPNMVNSYLNSLDANPGRLNSLQTLFQRYLTEEGYNELQMQLYGRMQQDQENPHYPELLSWVFIQRKDYRNALAPIESDRQTRERKWIKGLSIS